MTTAPMNGEDAPVTRRELRQELANFRVEFREELGQFRTDMSLEIAGAMNYVVETLGTRMRDDMAAMEARLARQIAGAALSAAEENRREIGVLDDKYRDLPGRVTLLERELDEHRRDTALHPRRRR